MGLLSAAHGKENAHYPGLTMKHKKKAERAEEEICKLREPMPGKDSLLNLQKGGSTLLWAHYSSTLLDYFST